MDFLKPIPDEYMKLYNRPFLDQLAEDLERRKKGIKMTVEDLFKCGQVVGSIDYIPTGKEDYRINRFDAYLLAKQMITALQVGRFCQVDYDDIDFALTIAKYRIGEFAMLTSQSAIKPNNG